MVISRQVGVVSVTATSAGVSWSAGLPAPQLAAMTDKARVLLVFRTGRTNTVYLRDTAAGANVVEVPTDAGAAPHIHQEQVGPWVWSRLPKFIYAASNTPVVIEVYEVVDK